MVNSTKKIVIVGPVYPFKGGISHYTSLLYRVLSKKFDVELISFKFQYPSFLYPGDEQTDYENDNFKINNTQYIMHSINPINWLNTAMKITKINPDLVIFQWWNPFFSPIFTSIAKLTRNNNKCKTIAICHNVLPHEKHIYDLAFTKLFFRFVDYFIVQSKIDEKKLLELKPEADYKKTFHPTYNVFKFEDISKETARKKINIGDEKKALLFFGFIREYKGLMTLIESVPGLKKRLNNLVVLVAGDFYTDKNKYLEKVKELNIEDCIIFKDGYIPDKEVGNYFSACDIVVLPYKSATQSGIVQIAYGFEKPVIVTNVGGLAEVVINGKTGFIIEPENHDELIDAVVKYYEEKLEFDFSKNIREEEQKYSWDRMSEIVEDYLGKQL